MTRYRVSGCENCNISVNNGKYRVGFQASDYKYLALLDTNFGLRFLGLYLTKMLHIWNLSSG